MSSDYNHPRAIYEIRVQGELDRGWEYWFDGLAVMLTYASER